MKPELSSFPPRTTETALHGCVQGRRSARPAALNAPQRPGRVEASVGTPAAAHPGTGGAGNQSRFPATAEGALGSAAGRTALHPWSRFPWGPREPASSLGAGNEPHGLDLQPVVSAPRTLPRGNLWPVRPVSRGGRQLREAGPASQMGLRLKH